MSTNIAKELAEWLGAQPEFAEVNIRALQSQFTQRLKIACGVQLGSSVRQSQFGGRSKLQTSQVYVNMAYDVSATGYQDDREAINRAIKDRLEQFNGRFVADGSRVLSAVLVDFSEGIDNEKGIAFDTHAVSVFYQDAVTRPPPASGDVFRWGADAFRWGTDRFLWN